MVKILIDIISTAICQPQIQILPVTVVSSSSQPTHQLSSQFPKICLTLLVLLLPYAYLIYMYSTSLLTLHNKNLFHEFDNLDIIIIVVSIMRLICMFMAVFLEHSQLQTVLSLFWLIWQIVVLFIFVGFRIQDWKFRRNLYIGVIVGYLLVWGIWNWGYHVQSSKNAHISDQYQLFIPILYPSLAISITVTAISILQFFSIQSALNQHILTQNITIQLKNRKSFIFLISSTLWLSLIMKKYPQLFKPILGIVIYFVLSQWANMAVIYRTVISRVVRSHQEETQSDSGMDGIQEGFGRRGSGVVVVEMKGYGGTNKNIRGNH